MSTTVERKTQLVNWVRTHRPELASRPVTDLPTAALLEASISLRVPVRTLLELRRRDTSAAPIAPANDSAPLNTPAAFAEVLPTGAIDLRSASDLVGSTLHEDEKEKRAELGKLLFRLNIRSRAYLDSLVEAVFDAAELLATGAAARLGLEEEAALSRAYHDANAHLAVVL